MDNIWGIILAAGASTRMKKQKMLLPYNGKTIIETVIGNASAFLNKKIVVVVGADKEKIVGKIKSHDTLIVFNGDFKMGMLSSVLKGLSAIPKSAEAIMIFLGDQPQLPVEVIKKVATAYKNSSKGIVIPVFSGKRGHPLLVDVKYFSEIEKLDHNKGLRSLAEKNAKDVLEVECTFPEILRDIDTPEEYEFEIYKVQQT